MRNNIEYTSYQYYLEIVNENFYKEFQVEAVLTKAIPAAEERIVALVQNG